MSDGPHPARAAVDEADEFFYSTLASNVATWRAAL